MKQKKAFTLVELMIVIAIIGALAAALLSQFGGLTESAKATKCRSNLRNLATAAQSYAVSHERYPLAGSLQLMSMGRKGGTLDFYEAKGWIGWNQSSRNVYPARGSGGGPIQLSWSAVYSDNMKSMDMGGLFAVTNGSLWELVHDFDSYVCPEHRALCRKHGFEPCWSYVMNSFFGYDYTRGHESAGVGSTEYDIGRRYGRLEQAVDRTLMFAELPFADIGLGLELVDRLSAGDTDGDCTLQFRTSKTDKFSDGTLKCNTTEWEGGHSEYIGFNHKVGGKLTAHIVFADAHVETLLAPAEITEDRLKRLTANLCNGIQVTLSNGRYLDIEGQE